MRTLIWIALCMGMVATCQAGVTVDDVEPVQQKTEKDNSRLSAAVRPSAERELWASEKGSTLKKSLEAWAKKSGWDLQWAAIKNDEEIDYPLPARLEFEGTFDQAASKFIRLYRDAEEPLTIDINITQRFIRVSLGGK